ncbi:class I SAM-dependent methyltransferase [Saccharopolyspora hirsuta]|uniref:Class I SAM-dependent methyltransferase n=1 Tax=Saccharopolyspora hirsuta TaxID=1837 RepID=A0A5M7BQT9_SACHI|nr:class I SAM-dependent methyltransferase [Saccharopolyspora hirsuta]KAA5830508.1 class I SAM-dependent methyltransferase [Saccharopolyspora hirsuta]
MTAPQEVVSYWNDRARSGYDQQPGQDRAAARWSARIAPLVADAVGAQARVLDSGCGTGFLARLLAAEGHRVTGQDVSAGMLAVAAERAEQQGLGVDWITGEAHTPPPGPFDVVVSRNVLWTLPNPGKAVESWRSVLRPGGLLLVTDAKWGAAEIGDDATEQRFSASYAGAEEFLPMASGLDFADCAELVREAGFVEVADRTGVFDEVPYPSAPGFFVLTARAPR